MPRARSTFTLELKTAVGNDGSKTGIFAIDPDTTAFTKICDFDGDIRVSRDGRTLALIRAGKTGNDGHDIDNVGVWTLDAKGKGEKRRVAAFGGVTSWSPDGKQIIVAKWLSKPSDDESRSENWRFNADGSALPSCRSPRPRKSTTGRLTAIGS